MSADISLKPLIISTFDGDRMASAPVTRWSDHRLSLESLTGMAKDARHVSPALADVSLRLVRPGDSVRIANVLDAIIPDIKAASPGGTFPGVLGPLAPAGAGRTNRLGGVAVLSVCDWLAAGYSAPDEFPDSLVDMAGPGQPVTLWGDRIVLVVVCTPKPGAAIGDVDRSVRRAALQVARSAASATLAAGAGCRGVVRFERASKPRFSTPSRSYFRSRPKALA